MKISKLLLGFIFGAFVGGANAADITIFYSPTCPHCHHARGFIEQTLIYEYEDLNVSTVNVMDADNRQMFMNALKKCNYERGGVPVMVIGDKCFQGYSDSMQSELRKAVEIDLTDEQKESATQNRAEMEKDKDAFVSLHSDRKNAVSETDAKKKITNKQDVLTDIALYVFLGLLIVGLGVVLFRKSK